ncbi:hypothetical protein [Dyadobacter sandarakinus]|uniref:hypothetical protein n=1 Tax=Dyadobacter sandarakinus TaxID=2747268 RepID=UPI001E46DF27|nr:hypothetical protein [Dyadobacter sandarakinus]
MNQLLPAFIDQIEKLQSKGDRYFPEGIFPAYRINTGIGYRRPDTTVFYSAVICFTLQRIRPQADAETASRIDDICKKVIQNYPDFRNKDGLKTYNFWKTRPSAHFPNGHIFRHFDHFRIPDDIDDTAFVYLTTNPHPDELTWLKQKLALHANGPNRPIRNTFPGYQQLRAYSTWFGKNMYTEFDASVLCNMLYCILHYRLPLNQHDHDSLAYIRSVIETGRYRSVPFRCAHQYPRTPLIIYHVARLIAAFDPPELTGIKPQLVDGARQILHTSTSPMDRVILSISLMRLGEATVRIPVESFTPADFRGFYFFIAGLLTAYEHPLLYRLSVMPLFHMHWICEAHCWTLLAEYEALWNTFSTPQDSHNPDITKVDTPCLNPPLKSV